MSPQPVDTAVGAFLLAFPALFSIINPPGGALIFHDTTRGMPTEDRRKVVSKIAIYACMLLLVSLWLGSYILNFFGVSLSALRVAGGLVVAVHAWNMLAQSDSAEKRREVPAEAANDMAFFPLTMPLTTGPGTIAVAIALASQRPADGALNFFGGLSLAAVSISLVVWLCYRWSHAIARLLGHGGARVMSRLVSFLLLCVGTQIILTGVLDLVEQLRH